VIDYRLDGVCNHYFPIYEGVNPSYKNGEIKLTCKVAKTVKGQLRYTFNSMVSVSHRSGLSLTFLSLGAFQGDSNLDRPKCPYSMTTTQNQLSQMTTTFQRNALDISYNGWENYETWNVALWINNTENLYHLAMEAGDYEAFVELVGNATTGDGVKFNDPRVNVIQLNSDVFDF
jgi:outer membrane receptor for ferrienterochelin and colicin